MVLSSVLRLTTENFSAVVEAPGKILVNFYAPWCSYCKRLEPEYEHAASLWQTAMDEDPDLVSRLAMVDAIEHKELATRFRVQSYPTLRWFVDGEPSEYSGSLSSDGISDWVISRGGPHVRVLPNASAVERFRLRNAICVIAQLSPSTLNDHTSRAYRTLVAAARQTDVPCGVTTGVPERLTLIRAADEVRIPNSALAEGPALPRRPWTLK